MTKGEYKLYLSSTEWIARRSKFLSTWNYCNRCDLPRWLAIIAYDQDLHVHHRHYQTVGKERPEDLEGLCKRCHEVETFGRSALKAVLPEKCAGCGGSNYDRFAAFCIRCVAVTDFVRDHPPPAPPFAFEKGNEKGKEGRS